MVFSSIPFLYYFLPIVIILYALSPKKLKNSTLLLVSIVFYAWGEPRYIVFMAVSVIFGYIFGLLTEKFRGTGAAKVFLILSLIESLGLLCYCKYANFFIENFNAMTGLSVGLLSITLPIGISFYTFQILSYVVDVYRGDVPAQRNLINLAAYVAMFPQLIAGPIVRYSDVRDQLEERTHTLEKTSVGIRRFIIGLAKKVLIANILGELVDIFKKSDDKSVLFFWIYAVAYMLHIYFDFSGYSDMAIGLGKLFGFDFVENFNYPYISKSITEFWRRWHMSLGSWFRDYVYIPLGGNRVSKPRQFFNIFVVWMLTGFWHGADWNFIIWGLFFAVLLTVEKYLYKKHLDNSKVFSHIYVLFFVMISFIIFDSTDLSFAGEVITSMFGFGGVPLVSTASVYYLESYAVVLIIAAVGATPVIRDLCTKLQNKGTAVSKVMNILEPVALAILLITVTGYLIDGSFNPFLYFRF